MAYDGKTLARARLKLEERRSANAAEQLRRTTSVYSRIPEIEQIDNQLRAQMARLVKLTLAGGYDLDKRLSELKEANLDLQMRKAELLTAAGYPIDYLNEIINCEKCHDSGVYNNGVCSCLDVLYNKELTAELGTLLKTGNESFAGFRIDYYSAEYDPTFHCVPRDSMQTVYEICRKFADNFPAVSSNLLLWGGPGLGKTYLSACIARSVAEKGHSVCYESAASAFDTFEQQKFSRDTAETEKAAARVTLMLECDLMILDDLGTEMTTALTMSALYTLLNTRLINGRPVIISTNLSPDELQRKYSRQICSRINGEFMHLPFVGSDIRALKKKA